MPTRVGISGHQSLKTRLAQQGALHTEEEAWVWVEQSFHALLTTLGAQDTVVLSSLAVGADQRLATIALQRGARFEAVIPSPRYIDTFETEEQRQVYEALLAQASEVVYLDFAEPSEAAFYAAGIYMVDHTDILVAVWDGQQAAGHGGTGDIVNYAAGQGRGVYHLDPIRRAIEHRGKAE